MGAATSDLDYRADIPDPGAFVRLFAATGWDPEGRLTVAAAAEAVSHSWYAVSAYDNTRLVGTGRIVGDGVLHALIADVIVDPGYRHRGIGSGIVARLVDECRRQRILDVQLFCARGVQPFYARLGLAARPDDAPSMELVAGGGRGAIDRQRLHSRRRSQTGRRPLRRRPLAEALAARTRAPDCPAVRSPRADARSAPRHGAGLRAGHARDHRAGDLTQPLAAATRGGTRRGDSGPVAERSRSERGIVTPELSSRAGRLPA